MAENEGEMVPVGPPQWWWKYAFPTKEVFWSTVMESAQLEQNVKPQPQPWRQSNAELLEASAMLHALSKVSDTALKTRLKSEVSAKLEGTLKQISAH